MSLQIQTIHPSLCKAYLYGLHQCSCIFLLSVELGQWRAWAGGDGRKEREWISIFILSVPALWGDFRVALPPTHHCFSQLAYSAWLFSLCVSVTLSFWVQEWCQLYYCKPLELAPFLMLPLYCIHTFANKPSLHYPNLCVPSVFLLGFWLYAWL